MFTRDVVAAPRAQMKIPPAAASLDPSMSSSCSSNNSGNSVGARLGGDRRHSTHLTDSAAAARACRWMCLFTSLEDLRLAGFSISLELRAAAEKSLRRGDKGGGGGDKSAVVLRALDESFAARRGQCALFRLLLSLRDEFLPDSEVSRFSAAAVWAACVDPSDLAPVAGGSSSSSSSSSGSRGAEEMSSLVCALLDRAAGAIAKCGFRRLQQSFARWGGLLGAAVDRQTVETLAAVLGKDEWETLMTTRAQLILVFEESSIKFKNEKLNFCDNLKAIEAACSSLCPPLAPARSLTPPGILECLIEDVCAWLMSVVRCLGRLHNNSNNIGSSNCSSSSSSSDVSVSSVVQAPPRGSLVTVRLSECSAAAKMTAHDGRQALHTLAAAPVAGGDGEDAETLLFSLLSEHTATELSSLDIVNQYVGLSVRNKQNAKAESINSKNNKFKRKKQKDETDSSELASDTLSDRLKEAPFSVIDKSVSRTHAETKFLKRSQCGFMASLSALKASGCVSISSSGKQIKKLVTMRFK
jgi:hypothetical protein